MLKLYVTSCAKHQGKTFISAGLAGTMQSLGYQTSVYKPVQTSGIERAGFMQSPDLTVVKSIDPYIKTQFTYLYKSELEPLIASEDENNPIDIDFLNKEVQKIQSNSDCTIIDGNGGLMSPLAPNQTNSDMIRKIQFPVLLVTTPDENAVNNSLLTIENAQNKGIQVRGVVINNIAENCKESVLTSVSRIIEEYTNVKILGLVSHLGKNYTPEDMITSILNGIDIESVFDVKIEKLGI